MAISLNDWKKNYGNDAKETYNTVMEKNRLIGNTILDKSSARIAQRMNKDEEEELKLYQSMEKAGGKYSRADERRKEIGSYALMSPSGIEYSRQRNKIRNAMKSIEHSDDEDSSESGTWFNKNSFKNILSNFDDGYDFGDGLKTLLNVDKAIVGTAADVGTNAAKGVIKAGESLADLAAYGGAGVVDMFGNHQYADEIRQAAAEDLTGKIFKPLDKIIDNNSILGEKSDAVINSIGQMYADSVVGSKILGKAANIPITVKGHTLNMPTTSILSGMSSGMGEAYQKGGNNKQALTKGITSGLAEGFSEGMFGFMGQGGSDLDDIIIGGLTKNFENNTIKSITKGALKGAGEGLEEMASYGLNYLADKGQDKIKNMLSSNAPDMANKWSNQELWDNFASGAIAGIAGGVPSTVYNIKNPGAAKFDATEGYEYNKKLANSLNDNQKVIYNTFLETAKNNNLDINNADLQQIGLINARRNINTLVDASFFQNNNEEAIWTISRNQEGNPRSIIINPKADSNKLLQNIEMHELYHDMYNSEAGQKITDLIIKYDQTKYQTKYTELENVYKDIYKEQYGTPQFDSLVHEEAVASILGEKLGDRNFLDSLTMNEPALFDKLDSFVTNKLNERNATKEFKNEKLFWKDIKNKIQKAYRQDYVDNNNVDKKYVRETSKRYGEYWKVETKKDIFKNIKNTKELQKKAFNYILNGNDNFKTIVDVIDGKKVKFVRISANEYLRGINSKKLNNIEYKQKMRLAPSIDDLINNAHMIYPAKLTHSSTLFKGFNNYQGQVKIDDTLFRYIVRVGKAKNDNLFYDISLENMGTEKGTDIEVPSVKNTSLLEKSVPLTETNISQSNNNVNSDISTKHSMQINQNNTQELDNSSFSLKQKQFDIIENSNPMLDEYHTGIRNIEDIKTLQETIEDSDWKDYKEYNPDLTRSMIESAIKNGKITIYSSFPIEQGIFVSPSKMEAESYSSDGKVYSKKVKIEDVAWIDPTQGQYAKLDNSDIKYSKDSNNWQVHLNKNYKSNNNGSTLEDIKIKNIETKEFVVNNKKVSGKDILKTTRNNEINNKQFDNNEENKSAKLLDKRPELEKPSIKDIKNKTIREIVNKGEAVDRLAKKTGNKELTYKYDHMGTAEAEGHYSIAVAQTDNNGNQIGKSIMEIWQPVENANLVDEFSNYLLHKHNIARFEQGKPVFGNDVTSDISKKYVSDAEKTYPQFKEWSNDIYTYNKNQMQNMVDAGLTSQESQEYLNNMYDNYIRINRDVKGNGPITQFNGNLKVNSPIKKAKGGNQDILPLKDSMSQQTIEIKKAIRKNEFGLELLKTLDNGQNVEYDGKQTVVKNDDGTYSFTVFKEGKPIKMEIDEGLYEALEPRKINDPTILAPIRKAASIQRELLTDKNPLFIATNFFKDFGDAPFNSKYAKDFFPSYIQGLKEIKNNSELWNKYKALGGEQNTYFDYKDGTKKISTSKVNKFVSKIQSANQIVEQAPRFAEFISTLKNGGTYTEAMYNAAEVTTNFKRGGEITKALNRNGANFLNASVQGFDKQIRNFTGQNGAKGYVNLLSKVVALGVLPSVLNHLLLDDDDDYKDLPDYVKDSYFLFKTGEHKFIRIPKGRVVSIFGMTARRTLEYKDGEKDAFKGISNQISNQVAPNNPLENNILSPIQAINKNVSWNGSAIVPARLQKELPENQYDEKTDAISKWVGKTFKVSPKKVNYILDQYTGGIGDILLPLITPEAHQNPLSAKFTTDSIMNNKNVSDFYNLKEEFTAKSSSTTATDDDIIKSKYLNSINYEMNELYKQKREIQNSSLSNKEKRQKVAEIQTQINDMAKFALQDYQDYVNYGNYSVIGDKEFYKNDKDEWVKISKEQQDKQQTASEKYDITPEDYYNNKEEYNYALQYEDKYYTMKKFGMSYEEYNNYVDEIKNIRDKYSQSTTANRKAKVFNYINGLKISKPAKIMLFKSGNYGINDYKEYMFNYINNLKISKKEKEQMWNYLYK